MLQFSRLSCLTILCVLSAVPFLKTAHANELHNLSPVEQGAPQTGVNIPPLPVDQRDRVDLALEIVNRGDEPLRRLHHLSLIAQAYHELGNSQTAKSILEQAVSAVNQSGDDAVDTSITPSFNLARIAEYSLQIGDVSHADALLMQALTYLEIDGSLASQPELSSSNRNPELSTGDFTLIAEIYGDVEDSAVAHQGLRSTIALLETYPPFGTNAKYIVKALAEGYADLSDTDAAMADLPRLQAVALRLLEPRPGDNPEEINSRDRPLILGYLANAYAQHGDFSTAESLLAEAVNSLQSNDLSEVNYPERTLSSVALSHRHVENSPVVQQNLSELTEHIQRILNNPVAEHAAMGAIARVQHALGNADAAQQAALISPLSSLQNLELVHQIQYLIEASKVYGSIDMLNEQQAMIDQAIALLRENMTDETVQFYNIPTLFQSILEISSESVRQQKLNELVAILPESSSILSSNLLASYRLTAAQANGDAEFRQALTALTSDMLTSEALTPGLRFRHFDVIASYYAELPEGPFRQSGFQTLQEYALQMAPEIEPIADETDLLNLLTFYHARIDGY